MISIIVPVYNIAKILHNCVESLLPQVVDGAEIILVNDGSKDDSGRVCDQYALVPGVKVVHKPNGGLSSARNAGIDASTGEWLMFVDGDDCLRPGTISLLNGILNQLQPGIDFIQYHYIETNDYPQAGEPVTCTETELITDRSVMFSRMLDLGGEGASACTKLINRRIFDNIRFKEGIIHEDEQFTPRLIAISRGGLHINAVPYIYVQRAGSIITSSYSHKRLDLIPVLQEQIQILEDNGLPALADRVRSKLFVSLCMLYANARRADYKDDVRLIEHEAKQLSRSADLKLSGQFSILAKGLRLHLPVLPMYYFYKRLR